MFKTIEQLKETLTEVSSARQQVSDTVAAYAHTQTAIRSYTENLIGIENALTKLIALLQKNEVTIEQQSSSAVSNLKKSCDTVLSKAKDELSMVSHKFTENTTTNINLLSKQIEKFNHVLGLINQLTSRVEQISAETKNLTSLITALRKDLSSSQTIQNDNINRMQSSLSSQIQTINESLKDIIVSFSNLQNCIKSYHNNIEISIDNLKDESEKQQQVVCKEVRNNKYLVIILLAGIIVDIMLRFVMR